MSGKRKMENMGASMGTDELVREAMREVEEKKKAKKQAQSGLHGPDRLIQCPRTITLKSSD